VNLHTWTGWGSVTYWNAFVANLEMHGKGRFFDPRLNDASRFPIAAANGFGNVMIDPAQDRITPKLPALHAYQLSIPVPKPPKTSFNPAAERGETLFNGKAQCARCHVPPLFTEPGWNAHLPADVCVDSFQADRAPDRIYRTSPLAGLSAHQKGGFYHDGRFGTLSNVVEHYNGCMNLQLSADETSDLVQYLLTL
jgi:cytochrome c peroxidase